MKYMYNVQTLRNVFKIFSFFRYEKKQTKRLILEIFLSFVHFHQLKFMVADHALKVVIHAWRTAAKWYKIEVEIKHKLFNTNCVLNLTGFFRLHNKFIFTDFDDKTVKIKFS